jgi:AraC family transcriptional regulator
MMGIDELSLAQKDGSLPKTLAAGSAPGESGVTVLSVRFQGSMHLAATLRQHLVCFQMAQTRFRCRMADRTLLHAPGPGSLAIGPAGIDCAADSSGSVDAILIAVDPGRFALAAAEGAALQAQLIERLSGYDQALLDLAETLALQAADNYPDGPLFWNEIASAFIDRLVTRYTSEFASAARNRLSKVVLERLRDYVVAHLDEPIEVATLARMAGRSPFHFTRVFARSVGVTPHRYVVRLRLQRAIELVRERRSCLAEIAVRTGFADQSHLSRWVRRVYGVPLTQFVADQR